MDRDIWRPYATRLLAGLHADGLVGRLELERAYWAYPRQGFRILDRTGVAANDNVLEVGTATGQLTGMLGELAGSRGKVFSLEPDPELVEATRHLLSRFDETAPRGIVEADALSWKPGAIPSADCSETVRCCLSRIGSRASALQIASTCSARAKLSSRATTTR